MQIYETQELVPFFFCMYWVKSGWMRSSFAVGRCSFPVSRQRSSTSRNGGDSFSGTGGVDWEFAICYKLQQIINFFT